MKKYLFCALTAVLLMPGLAHAVSDENVTNRRPDRPARAEVQEIRQEIRSSVAQNHARRLTRRFQFYFDRLSKIITRFEARLAILDTAGKDTADAKAKLALVKTKLGEAKSKGDATITAFTAIDPAKFSEQKEAAFAARDLAVSARKLYQETLVLLKDALKALKVISRPALPANEEAL